MRCAITRRNSAEAKFRLAVDSCPGCMMMIDSAGKILLVNAETEKLFQYRRKEMVGQSVEMLMPARYRAKFPRYRAAFCKEFRLPGKGGEFFGARRDGTEFPVEIALNVLHMPDGSVVIMCAINDISNRKRNDDMKDEFVAMVSHELRTPLTSIAASLGLLVADPAGKHSDAAMRLLRIAHSNSQRLVRLVNDILDMEKIESGNVEFQMRTFPVRPLVEQAIEANGGFSDQFGVAVRLDAESDDADVHADFDRLMQVVVNLLSNAVKFSPRGSEVSVTIENIGTNVRIAVRDHGPGIPAAFRSHVFERFAQAESASAHKNGSSGLGLSIVKQIVIKLGGDIGFETVQDEGTVFYVDLPRQDAERTTKIGDVDDSQIRETA